VSRRNSAAAAVAGTRRAAAGITRAGGAFGFGPKRPVGFNRNRLSLSAEIACRKLRNLHVDRRAHGERAPAVRRVDGRTHSRRRRGEPSAAKPPVSRTSTTAPRGLDRGLMRALAAGRYWLYGCTSPITC
jgi:hypothetical protein